MATLDDLIDFIENNPPGESYWSPSDWETNLTRSIPNWRDIIAEAHTDPLKRIFVCRFAADSYLF